MTISGELDYRILYDVEHDLFHAQNIFSDEYIKPTFVEYVHKLEKENVELKEYNKYLRRKRQGGVQKQYNKVAIIKQQDDQLTKAKEIIKKFSEFVNNEIEYDPEHPQEHTDLWNKLCEESEEFLKENEK